MTMNVTRKAGVFGIVVVAVFTTLVLLQKPLAGESGREADGARLLRGAIDMHFHVDATTPDGTGEQADIAKVRVARMRGLRGLVIKNHFESTATLAYLLRKEIPGIELFGGIVMNLTNGGMNPAAVDYMATRIQGAPGKSSGCRPAIPRSSHAPPNNRTSLLCPFRAMASCCRPPRK